MQNIVKKLKNEHNFYIFFQWNFILFYNDMKNMC